MWVQDTYTDFLLFLAFIFVSFLFIISLGFSFFIPFVSLYYYLLKEKAMDIPSSSLIIHLIHHLS